MIFEILDDMATKAVKKTEGQITRAAKKLSGGWTTSPAKKIMGNWFSDVTGKTYYNTTRAKAEQYEAASERMKANPDLYKGWMKTSVSDTTPTPAQGTERDLDEEWEQFQREHANEFKPDYDIEDVLEIKDLPDYIDYDDLPTDLKNTLHDERIGSDDEEKGALIQYLSEDGWSGINIQALKADSSTGALKLLASLELYF